MRKALLLLFCCFFAFSCARDVSSDSYSASSAGSVGKVDEGIIIEIREVKLEGSNSGAGTTVGSLAGGAAGATIGQGRGSLLGMVGGAIAGAFVGAFTEKELTEQKANQYFIRLNSGSIITVIQGKKNALSVGQKVMVLYGRETKVIPI